MIGKPQARLETGTAADTTVLEAQFFRACSRLISVVPGAVAAMSDTAARTLISELSVGRRSVYDISIEAHQLDEAASRILYDLEAATLQPPPGWVLDLGLLPPLSRLRISPP